MAVDLKVNMDPEGALNALEETGRSMADMRPAMRIVHEIAQTAIIKNFEQGGPGWKALSATTIAARKKIGKWPGRILVRNPHGGLMGSIFYTEGKDRLTITANKEYAAVQQFGASKGEFGTRAVRVSEHTRKAKSGKTATVKAHDRKMAMPWGDIPARPFMVIREADEAEIRAAVRDFITGEAL